ncbi:MAG TPA: glutaredoxin domain-containing protein [Actinomycetales bacterium]|nr:glutaredoxin domain-containing protein [Actinomycetales bacterium]
MAAGTALEKRRFVVTARRWLPSAWLLLVAAILLVVGRVDMSSVLVTVVLAAPAVVLSPRLFPRSPSDAAARELAAARDVPLIYWRPGCSYCLRLRIALNRLGNRAVWVDVSQDDAASSRVREVNDGNETVPTVFHGPSVWVNPRVGWVRAHLQSP